MLNLKPLFAAALLLTPQLVLAQSAEERGLEIAQAADA